MALVNSEHIIVLSFISPSTQKTKKQGKHVIAWCHASPVSLGEIHTITSLEVSKRERWVVSLCTRACATDGLKGSY